MKKVFYDIIPSEKRSIRNIPITKKGESDLEVQSTAHLHHTVDGIRPIVRTEKSTSSNNDEENTSTSNEETFEEWRNTRKNSFWRAWVAICLCVLASIFIFTVYFSKATITINPVKHDIVLKELSLPFKSLKYEVISTEITKSKEIKANGTIKVDRKASGKIVLYNAYNSAVQKLVAGTRLETPNGLIYKLKNTVSIPGQKTILGKKTPGSVEAEIEASESGDTYNQGFKDFNVVAYKNSDRYTAIYGRSKTSLSNGFSGTVPNISTNDVSNTSESLKTDIANEADSYFTKASKSKGDSFEYIPSAKKIAYNDIKQDVSKDGKTATITLTAKVETALFESTSLFEGIMKAQTNEDTSTSTDDTAENSADEIVYTGDATKLNVIWKSDENKILVSGTTTISSAIDVPKVTKAVSRLEKEQAIGAIKRLVELETIEIDIRPWWNSKLPSSDKIEIKTEK